MRTPESSQALKYCGVLVGCLRGMGEEEEEEEEGS